MVRHPPLCEDGGSFTFEPGRWRVRPVVLAIIRRPRDGAILVQPDRTSPDGREFFRLPGGGLDFGEEIEHAIQREAREELGAVLADVRFERVMSAFFHTPEEAHHELCLIFTAGFADPALYEREEFRWVDGGNRASRAVWVAAEELIAAGEAEPARCRPRGLGVLVRDMVEREGVLG